MKKFNIDEIQVSQKLDNVINGAVKEGYKGKKNRKYKGGFIAVASAIMITTLVLKPEFVEATMDKLKNSIESFYLGEKEYSIPEEYKTVIGQTIEDEKIKVTLNEFYIDKDIIIITTNLDSRERNDYAQGLNTDVYINDVLIEKSSNDSFIHNEDGTVDILTIISTENININEDINVVIDYNNIDVTNKFDINKSVSGEWVYNFTVDCSLLSNSIVTKEIKETVFIDENELSINKVTISPNIITLNAEFNQDVSYIIKDDKGYEYTSKSGFGTSDGNMNNIYLIDTVDINIITIIAKSDLHSEIPTLNYDEGITIDLK